MKQKLIGLKGDIDKSINIIGNINICLLPTDRKSKQKISKNIEYLNKLSTDLTKLTFAKHSS